MSREKRIVDGEIALVPYYPNYAAALPWYQDPALCRQATAAAAHTIWSC